MLQKWKRRTRLHPAAFQEHHRKLLTRIRKTPTTHNHDPHLSRGPSPALESNDFVKWDVLAVESIPFDKIDLTADMNMTSNSAYHAAAILFFMDVVLGLKVSNSQKRKIHCMPDRWPPSTTP